MLENCKKMDTHAIQMMNGFFDQLTGPICLVAHNGNEFDYPILKEHLNQLVRRSNLYISLNFHRLLTVVMNFYIFCHVQNCSLDGNLLCVDSLQIFRLIDKCSSFIKGSYKLIDIYRRLFQSDPVDAHSAEGDAMILFKCVVASRFAFVAMADLKAVNFNKTQFD